MFVTSSNKKSESHSFLYTPLVQTQGGLAHNGTGLLMPVRVNNSSMGTMLNNSLTNSQGIYYHFFSSHYYGINLNCIMSQKSTKNIQILFK